MSKVKEKSDIKPIIVKFGVALALSFASFLYSRLRNRRARPQSLPPPNPQSPRSSSDFGSQIESTRKGELETGMTRPTAYGVASVPPEKYEEANLQKFSSDHSDTGLSPRSKLNGDKEAVLLPDFSLEAMDIPSSDVKPPKAFVNAQKDEQEEEILRLQDTVRALRERERSLEDQLLEFYGLKEQQSTISELQSRLKLNNMESKLFSLKVESLKAENQKLKEQVADRTNVEADLEAARAKIKLLKKKLRFEAEQNKEQIVKLHERVMKFQDEEVKSLSSCAEVQSKLKRLGELECEIKELRKSNSTLQHENSELSRTLESTQILANSVVEDSQTNALREASEQLRQENKDLRQEIEQMKADRCSDVEELVYLRWINACLRYELRNYHPAGGKTVVARDLSKTMSPESEEKAKQLIIEYANSEGISGMEINFMDLFDSDQWSDSHASFTDSAELDESSLDNSSVAKTHSWSRKRFLSKLRKLMSGKDAESVEDMDSLRCNSNRFRVSSDKVPREGRVSDMGNEQSSDVGASCVYKSFVLGRESGADSTPKEQRERLSDSADRTELFKYAEALKRSRRGSLNLHRKSASYSSF